MGEVWGGFRKVLGVVGHTVQLGMTISKHGTARAAANQNAEEQHNQRTKAHPTPKAKRPDARQRKCNRSRGSAKESKHTQGQARQHRATKGRDTVPTRKKNATPGETTQREQSAGMHTIVRQNEATQRNAAHRPADESPTSQKKAMQHGACPRKAPRIISKQRIAAQHTATKARHCKQGMWVGQAKRARQASQLGQPAQATQAERAR